MILTESLYLKNKTNQETSREVISTLFYFVKEYLSITRGSVSLNQTDPGNFDHV